MAHFYGTIRGSRGEASRLGTKRSGLRTVTASWNGAVVTWLHLGPDGSDWATVSLEPHRGSGTSRTLYHGPVGGQEGKVT